MNKPQWDLNHIINIFVPENAFENVVSEMLAILPGSQCINTMRQLSPDADYM